MTDAKTLIYVDSLSKRFGKIHALDNISMQINKGEIVALLGANGAGKTTLINLLLGRLLADSGEIRIFNHAPGSLIARQRIGAILQSAKMPGTLTIYEHIELFSSYYPNPLPIKETLAIASLSDLAQRKFDALSGGQQQRLFFALAICGQPEIVFLDEPTNGLDVHARRDFWNCIRRLSEQGTTVLLTTHYLEEADALADRIILLNKGSIVHQGTSETIKAQLGGKRIRFKTDNIKFDFSSLAFVNKVDMRGSFIELMSTHAEATLQALFAASIAINDLTIEQVSLEDAFIRMADSNYISSQEKSL